jgi:translation initiation factor 1 (eIF-1/SUI1)
MTKFILIVLTIIFLSSSSLIYASHPVDFDKDKANSYSLAYPGMMPDSPFFVFKKARDSINLFFISDDLKKVERLITIGDKYIAGAKLINEKNKNSKHTLSSVSQGVDNLEKSYLLVSSTKQETPLKNILIDRIEKASDKYFLVITEIQESQVDKKSYAKYLSKTHELSELASKLSSK